MIESYARWLLKWKYLVIFIVLGLVGLAAIGIEKLQFKNDYRMFFSKENQELAAFEKLQNMYTRNDNILIVIAPKNGDVFTHETLSLIEDATKTAWQAPYMIRADSLTNFQYSRSENDVLVVSDLVRDAYKLDSTDIERIRNIALAEPLLVNQLISRPGHVTAINIIVQRPGLNQMSETQKVSDFVRHAIKDKITATHPNIDVYLTGSVMMDAAFADASEHDGKTLTPLMLVIIIITLTWFLQSFYGTLVTVAVISLSILTSLGIAGWLGIPLSPSSIPAPTILLTLAVADSVHMLTGYYDGLRANLESSEAMIQSLKLNFSAIFFTSLTTAISFLSMNFSDAPPFHDLGNITAIGVCLAFVLSITLLPIFTLMLPATKRLKSISGHNTLLWFAEQAIRRQKSWYLGILVITVLCISFVSQNELNDEFVKYFSPDTEFRYATDFANDNITGIYLIDYSLESLTPGGVNDPNYLSKMDDFANWWRQQPETLHVFSITDVFKRLNKNMNGDDPAFYRLPDSREMTAQYLLLYEMSLPVGLDLNDRININKTASRLTVSLKSISTNQLLALESQASDWLKQNAPSIQHSNGTGIAMMFARISSHNILSMISGEVLSTILISLILMFVLRSFTMGLISLIPNLLPAAMAFGFWGMIVGRVGLASSVVAAMTLGILVDDTVHFLGKYLYARRENGLSTEDALRYAFSSVGQAIWVTSAVLMTGFGILAFSDFKINAEMGLLTTIIIGFGLFAEFILLPPILLAIEGMSQYFKSKIPGKNELFPH